MWYYTGRSAGGNVALGKVMHSLCVRLFNLIQKAEKWSRFIYIFLCLLQLSFASACSLTAVVYRINFMVGAMARTI